MPRRGLQTLPAEGPRRHSWNGLTRLGQKAIDRCEQAAFRPELAPSRLGLVELLLEHYPDEHDAAIEHLDFAIAEFQAMKMQPALERALGRRGLLKA